MAWSDLIWFGLDWLGRNHRDWTEHPTMKTMWQPGQELTSDLTILQTELYQMEWTDVQGSRTLNIFKSELDELFN